MPLASSTIENRPCKLKQRYQYMIDPNLVFVSHMFSDVVIDISNFCAGQLPNRLLPLFTLLWSLYFVLKLDAFYPFHPRWIWIQDFYSGYFPIADGEHKCTIA
ncbi:hypothetical protein ACGC1H_007321 [Rhizoctonia solani]